MAEGVRIAVRDSLQLSVDVSELLRHPGATKPVEGRRTVAGIALPLARVPDDTELQLDLRLEALVDGIHATGVVRAAVELECRRCLTTFMHDSEVPMDALYLSGGEGDDDTYPIADEMLDLEPAIRDAVMLSLPLNPLCKAGCKGLCAVCGADRNATDCGHAERQSDIRWTALEDLRRKMEE